MARWLLLGCSLVVVCSLVGCPGSGSKPTVAVSGTVELDTKPLPEGTISLFGESGSAPDMFPIKDGKFEGQATPGKKRVEIRAERPIKGAKETGVNVENYIPPQYNSQTKLTAEVGASGGITPSNFALTSN